MRGSIVRRGKRYYVVYSFKGKQKWKAAGTSRKGAERVLDDIVPKINRGEYRELKRVTFAEFAKKWLSEYASGSVKASTLESYKYIFRVHLVPFFGDYELGAITPEDVQAYVSRKRKEGRLSPKTINNTLVPVKELFKHALRWGYLRENPAAYVEKPRVPYKEMDFLIPEEIGLFLKHTPEKCYALFLTAIMTGMRRGELLAMRWVNLDWNRGQYFVKESLYRGCFVETKSPSSRRAINLTPTLLEVLREHKEKQEAKQIKQEINEMVLALQPKENSKTKQEVDELALVFCTKEGKPLDPDNLVKRDFHRILDAAGIRHIRFHDLRHTYITLLIAQGENLKYVQNQAGHASIQTTMKYAHVIPDTHKKAAKRLDRALSEFLVEKEAPKETRDLSGQAVH